MNAPDRKVVLGLGNLLNRDEGFGIHALQALVQRQISGLQVEYIDGGVLGMNLLPLVEECSHLLVIDAIQAGSAPGTIIELDGQEIPLFAGIKLSEHQVGFQEVLGVASFRDRFPEHLHLVGVQPEDLSLGLGLSQPAETALNEVIERAQQVLLSW